MTGQAEFTVHALLQGLMEAEQAKVRDLEHDRQQQLKAIEDLEESLSTSHSTHQHLVNELKHQAGDLEQQLADAEAAAAVADSRLVTTNLVFSSWLVLHSVL